MIDVKFNEAMKPLVQAMMDTINGFPTWSEITPQHRNSAAAAVVEALGIPAQMVASPTFMKDLKVLVGAHVAVSKLPPIRADEPEAITEPGLPAFASATCSKSEPCPACTSDGAVPGKGFVQGGEDPMRTSSDGPPDPPACGAPTDSAT